MVRGEAEAVKVHYKGESDDFIVLATSVDAVAKWKEDKSIPLIDVVDGFHIFVTHNQGVQGVLNRASNAALENEFGTSKDDEVVAKILEKGQTQEVKVPGRQGQTNLSNATGSN